MYKIKIIAETKVGVIDENMEEDVLDEIEKDLDNSLHDWEIKVSK